MIMLRLLRCFFFAAICAALSFSPVVLAKGDIDKYRDILRDGVVLVQTQKWEIAADYWAQKAEEVAEQEDADLSQLAFLSLLMTISHERANNAAAYQSWTHALGLYLQNGTNWDRERQALADAIEQVKYEVSTSFSSDGVGLTSDAKNALVMESLDNILQFTQYSGPKPGLYVREEDDEGHVSVSRTYFPRPSLFLDTDSAKIIDRSRGVAGEAIESKVKSGAISRGFQPLATGNLDRADDETLAQKSITKASGEVVDFQLGLDLLSSGLPIAPPPLAFPTIAIDQQILDPIPVPTEASPVLQVEEIEKIKIEETENENKKKKLVTRRTFGSDNNKLTDAEIEFGKRAWRYFENNYQANTGLYNSVHKYPYATMWDIGSALAALYCAHDIGIIDDRYFGERVAAILNTLRDIPLYKNKLPNREYDTRSGLMTNLKNVVDDHGSGYSSLDIGRTLTWLAIISENHTDLSPIIADIVKQWDIAGAIEGGEFFRELLIKGQVDRKQEGRIGYEQYAALAFAKWNEDANNAMDIDDTAPVIVSGVEVLRDTRTPDFLNLEPYLIVMLEYAPAPNIIVEQISALINAHIAYADEKGVFALFTEDSIDETPWFLYNIVASEQGNWLCKSSRNKIQKRCQTLSTKAAFMADALFDLDYVKMAFDEVEGNFHTRKGYYAGIYDDGVANKALTSNTNALILESLAFKKRGSAFIDSAYSQREIASRSRLAN